MLCYLACLFWFNTKVHLCGTGKFAIFWPTPDFNGRTFSSSQQRGPQFLQLQCPTRGTVQGMFRYHKEQTPYPFLCQRTCAAGIILSKRFCRQVRPSRSLSFLELDIFLACVNSHNLSRMFYDIFLANEEQFPMGVLWPHKGRERIKTNSRKWGWNMDKYFCTMFYIM